MEKSLKISFKNEQTDIVKLSWDNFQKVIHILNTVEGATIYLPIEHNVRDLSQCFIINAGKNSVSIRSSNGDTIALIDPLFNENNTSNIYLFSLIDPSKDNYQSWYVMPIGNIGSGTVANQVVADGLIDTSNILSVNFPVFYYINSINNNFIGKSSDRGSLIKIGDLSSVDDLVYILPSVKTVGNGFFLFVENNMAYERILTIKTIGKDTIDSDATNTITIGAKQISLIVSDGIGSYTSSLIYNPVSSLPPNITNITSQNISIDAINGAANIQIFQGGIIPNSTEINLTFDSGSYGKVWVALNSSSNDIRLNGSSLLKTGTILKAGTVNLLSSYGGNKDYSFISANLFSSLYVGDLSLGTNLTCSTLSSSKQAINVAVQQGNYLKILSPGSPTSLNALTINGGINLNGNLAQKFINRNTPDNLIQFYKTSSSVYNGVQPLKQIFGEYPSLFLQRTTSYTPTNSFPPALILSSTSINQVKKSVALCVANSSGPYFADATAALAANSTSTNYGDVIPLSVKSGGTGFTDLTSYANKILPYVTPADKSTGTLLYWNVPSGSLPGKWDLIIPPAALGTYVLKITKSGGRWGTPYWAVP